MRVSDWSKTQLVHVLANQGVLLVCPPFTYHIRSEIPVVADGLMALYGDHQAHPAGADLFVDFTVDVKTLHRGYKKLCEVVLNGHRPFTPLAYGEAYAILEWGMNWCVTSYCHNWLVVHSAVLELGGRALVMPAPPGSGKSTLCAALMLDGWRLLSDEMALIDPVARKVQPVPRPVSLKNQSIDIVRARAPGHVMGPVARDTAKGTVAHLRASPDSLAKADECAEIAWIVYPKYLAGAATEVQPVLQAESLVALAENSFNHALHGEVGFQTLFAVVEKSSSMRLQYSRLDEILRWFRDLAAA